MRKIVLTLIASLMVYGASTSAMSYEQARVQALFLTDKMAYELNLTEAQYEAAYEINLDYLMSVNTVDDLYGMYWSHRNVDLSYILYDWQYRAYVEAAYFYRPLRWDSGYWRFGVYARYPRRDYYYFGQPSFYNVYNGAHSWRMNGGRSWYNGRELFYGRDYNSRYGMRDSYLRGDYNRGGSRPIRTTAIAASATSNAAISMDHVITNITHRERVLLVQQLLNRITGITLEGVEVTVAQQEAMSQVAHSAPQATALVEVAQHSVVVAQVEVITQTEGVPSEDIDNDIRYNKETLIQSGLNTKH